MRHLQACDPLREPAADSRAERGAGALDGDDSTLCQIDAAGSVKRSCHHSRHCDALQAGPDTVRDFDRDEAPPSPQKVSPDATHRQDQERHKQDRPVVAALRGLHAEDGCDDHHALCDHDRGCDEGWAIGLALRNRGHAVERYDGCISEMFWPASAAPCIGRGRPQSGSTDHGAPDQPVQQGLDDPSVSPLCRQEPFATRERWRAAR